MLRLALVITELEPGGAERCLVNLATGLDRERYEPVIYSLAARPGPGRDTLVSQLEAAGIPVRFLNLRLKWQAIAAIGKLAAHFLEQRPDIVQTFLFHANVLGALAARRAKVPHLVMGIRVADPRRWRWPLERWCASKADRIVCVSHSVADFCHTRCKFPAEKLVVVPNGVDVERFQNARPVELTSLGLRPGRKMILYVGRLDRQKGLDWLFGAAESFLPKLAEHELVLVGDGPERATLERRAAAQPLRGRVQFAGYRDDVPQLLAAAELLVLPSRWEGMPNVVLEAMASARPVVATQAEGVIEVLGEQATSQTVAGGDIAALAERVVRIAQDARLCYHLGASNLERARNHFSIPSMVAQYGQLYDALAAKSSPAFFS